MLLPALLFHGRIKDFNAALIFPVLTRVIPHGGLLPFPTTNLHWLGIAENLRWLHMHSMDCVRYQSGKTKMNQ
jgi:hypothetical protein